MVIGPGGVKMTQPTLRAILGMFNLVQYNRIIYKNRVINDRKAVNGVG
jgi:hypothetical protein